MCKQKVPNRLRLTTDDFPQPLIEKLITKLTGNGLQRHFCILRGETDLNRTLGSILQMNKASVGEFMSHLQ